MRLRLLTLAVLVLALAVNAQAATTISLSGGEPQMMLKQEGRSGLSYHIEVGRIEAEGVSTKGGDFTRLAIPGFYTTMIEGAPELPQMNRLIAVPFGAAARVEVSNVVTRTVRLADHGLDAPVMPRQPSLSKSADPAAVPFVHDLAAYAMDKVQPELARVAYQGRMRAMDIARLEIAPVSYRPASGELEIVESMDVTVTFEGGDWARTEALLQATESPFFAPVYAKVDGRAAHTAKADLVQDPVKMVIITPPEFEAQLQDFVAWKTERGFDMITGVIGSPEVGTTTATIQTYLHGLYNAGTPEDPAPSFVMFIGDVAQCPTFSLNGDASDRPYCETTGDLFPEMYYGRLSATNSSQLQAILDKTMTYDTFSMADPSYLDNVTLIAGVDGSFAPTHGNGTIRYGDDYYFDAAHNINAYTYYYPESGSSEAAILGNCNDGIGFINYTAHGSETSWYDPAFSQANINALTNDGKYFLAIGNCCLTSTYDYAECFGETFLRAPNKGAIGYIGGSNSTYWDEDVWWSVGNLPSGSIRDGMTYEETGLGVYDALFHDMPGVTEDDWYVTNDAIIFCGNLAVTESGSGLTEYYWNIYNLLGDPSIATYLGAPQNNAMTYPTTVFVGVPNITINADHGTYVGLSQAGELVGAGYVDASGAVDITFSRVLTPGVPLKMVAMAQNRVPVISELNVIVPAVVGIDPLVIDANVATDITVTVMEEDGVTPKPGINIWAEGLQYATTPVATDASGVAVISVNYPYGPSLDIVGQDPAESYRLFTEQVTVNALAIPAPDLYVTTSIGMNDMFPLNLPAQLFARSGATPFTVHALLPDGSLLSGSSPLAVTATEPGQVTGIIAASGYDLYTEVFDVVEAYGTVAGAVTSGGSAMSGVTVRLVDDMGNDVFASVTDAAGAYASPDEVLVDDYTLVVDHFGYLHYEQAVFVNYGANTFDIALDAAPSGVLTGHVYDSVTMEPLQATVRVYRPDTGELYNEVVCDVDGLYTTGSLPYFTYEVKVRAFHHVPVATGLTIDAPSLEKDWVLDPTNGDLLLINDTGAKSAPAKFSDKGELLAPAYEQPADKSVAELTTDLEDLGYYVSQADAATVDPATFWDYDLVILSCGANTSTLGNAALKAGLAQFAQEGGHILLEGGELGYNQASSGDFATYVMHSNDWNADSAGNISVPSSTHAVATYPNDLTGSEIAVTYSGYGDSDAMAPLADAEAVAVWTGYASDASVLAYDPNPAPNGGQIVFFCFNYAAAGAARVELLENAVIYLLTPELGTSGVSGAVTLDGNPDSAGITVRAIPNGGSTVTAADGSYALSGLFAGTYDIIASKDGWSTAAQTVTLVEGQTTTGVDMVLTPVSSHEYCDQPGAAISDNQTTTVTMDVPADGTTVSEVEVYVNITHTYIGDLILTLTAPSGTSVTLHNRSGGSADNIVGWYPGSLTPAEDLAAFAGESMPGTWTLTVSDNAGGDTGTINEWCLNIVHDSGSVTGVEDQGGVPMVFRSYQNYPNPFNPMTTIRFDLPRAGHVSLRVYDLAGRLVRELVNGDLAAASHTVVWDGADNAGRRMSSGIYYYRLTTGDDVATRKMTLVK
jgi:subtilisin-like proprotein convertase family protein